MQLFFLHTVYTFLNLAYSSL
nr:unnamed protein product [Callosobruchus chinensis]